MTRANTFRAALCGNYNGLINCIRTIQKGKKKLPFRAAFELPLKFFFLF